MKTDILKTLGLKQKSRLPLKFKEPGFLRIEIVKKIQNNEVINNIFFLIFFITGLINIIYKYIIIKTNLDKMPEFVPLWLLNSNPNKQLTQSNNLIYIPLAETFLFMISTILIYITYKYSRIISYLMMGIFIITQILFAISVFNIIKISTL